MKSTRQLQLRVPSGQSSTVKSILQCICWSTILFDFEVNIFGEHPNPLSRFVFVTFLWWESSKLLFLSSFSGFIRLVSGPVSEELMSWVGYQWEIRHSTRHHLKVKVHPMFCRLYCAIHAMFWVGLVVFIRAKVKIMCPFFFIRPVSIKHCAS